MNTKYKSALFSEMVRDRAKPMKIWDHIHCQRSQLKIFIKGQKFEIFAKMCITHNVRDISKQINK